MRTADDFDEAKRARAPLIAIVEAEAENRRTLEQATQASLEESFFSLPAKDEQLQLLANMCHYNGEALMRALEGFQLQVLRGACETALARKRPVWRPDIRIAPLRILLLGLAVAHTARFLPKRPACQRRVTGGPGG